MDAGVLVRQARESSGLSQTEVALRAGTSQPAIAAYESGAKSPSVRTFNKIIRACGYTITAELHPAPSVEGNLLDMVRGHQAELRQAAISRRIRNLRIFGSATRADSTENSDIDLLVEFDPIKEGLLPLIGFQREAELILGRHVDVSTLQMLRDEVREQALAEVVPL